MTKRRRTGLWFWPVLAVSGILRAAAAGMPAPGRDEAAYHYWAVHGEPAYAPLLQIAVRAAGLLPLPDTVALRAPSLAGGLLALFLLHRLLRRFDFSPGAARAVTAAVALTPWQVYTGGLLHPDALFLCTVLAAAWAGTAGRMWLAAAALGLAVLAKPTGVVVLAAGTLYLWRRPLTRPVKTGLTLAAWAVASPALVSLRPPMLEAMASFGRIPAGASTPGAAAAFLAAFLGLAALFLPAAGLQGLLRDFRRLPGRLSRPPIRDLSWWLGAALILAFAAAAVFRGQLKANWVLPGLVLLLPYATVHRHRALMAVNAVVSGALAGGMTLSLVTGEPLASVERSVGWFPGSYEAQAGHREAQVSAADSWTERVGEYRSPGAFVDSVRSFWAGAVPSDPGDFPGPPWVVSDDYGLAAQLVYAWNRSRSRLVLPGDGMYFRATRRAAGHMRGSVLVLGVHARPDFPPIRRFSPRAETRLSHPVTGSPVTLWVVDAPSPKP